MEFEGELTIEADAERVWELVSDPEVLMKCVPGAEEVNQVSETKYTGVIERGMAGITVSLDGEAEIVELDPPETIVATATGQDSRTNSRLDADIELTIEPSGDQSTLHYVIDLDFTGRLATLGSRIVKRKISSDINTFLDNLKNEVESGN